MISAATKELINELRQSKEYMDFIKARDLAFENPYILALYNEYRKLLLAAQVNSVSRKKDEDVLEMLSQLATCLHTDELASNFLVCEHKLNALLAGIYKELAHAVDADLGFLEE